MTACPSCGVENRADARFCDSCGAALEPVAAHAREERKIVSVLFCDLVGFTAASEQADPEDVRARLQPYHQLLRERIEAYGGVVEKFIGDAVMAVFGAPVAHEDDAERAVRAGLSILESLEELDVDVPGLDVRIGVNTGEALVSLGARPERGEGIVTGDVVNTAARIQSSAPINGIAVGEGTYRATQPVFEWEELEPIEAKGKSAPVHVRRPLRPVARFGSDVIRTHTTPFVGREVEQSLLGGLLDRAIRDRSVQLVTLVGEPGVGKSRQVAELLQDVDRRTELVRWRQGRCLPYGDGIAFWALGEIVKAHAGIFESDSPEITRDKLRAVLSEGDEGAWIEERLLPLVGIEAATRVERAESFTAWRTFLESIADRDPTVLVVEDLHWADLALLDFLEHLVEHASGVPLFVLATGRPELADRAPGWAGGLRNATTITLNPLSETETARLVNGLLEQTLLPAELQQAIIERAGGNPLYAEEVVRLLRDRGLLDGPAALADLPLPETVQALIASRLDTLSPERKGLLQDASVLGKVFWSGGVAAIGGTSEQHVEVGLHELERREFVRPSRTSAVEGNREIAFWHALVRDVAYGQIPRPQRAQKHLAAAGWIEESAGGRVEDVADLIAHHLGQAVALYDAVGEQERAEVLRPRVQRALVLAAERALGLDPPRAIAHLDRALELTSDEAERLELSVLRADAAIQAGRVQEAAWALDEVMPALRAGSDAVLAARALALRSLVSRYIGEDDLLSWEEEAVARLEPSGPSRPLLDALTELAGVLTVLERNDDAAVVADRAFALADELGIERPARLLGFRGTQRFFLGDRGGLDDMDQAYERLVASGASRFATVVRFNRVRSWWHLEGPRTLDEFLGARDFALSRGQELSVRFSFGAIAFCLAAQGRYAEVVRFTEDHIGEIDAVGDLFMSETLRSWLAAAYAAQGDSEAAELELLAVLETAIGERRGHALVIASHVARLRGQPAHAAELLVEHFDTRNVTKHPPTIGNLPLLARTAAAVGETRRMAEFVEQVYPGFGFTYIDTVATAARAVLAHADGDHQLAAELAGSVVEPLADALAFPERGYALLLLGQAKLALGDPSGLDVIRGARDVFAELGMRPALAEAEALLEGEVAAEA
ncbi:MAG TPA: adenylate/guanylate cyclase domain-containing protein [Gaiellaceae bacterium]|nr:adenylate/guanylate cyclase domain-containing protein [Gaiellaceae bacterium]